MTTISLADWAQSPDIVVGASEHRRLTAAALTDVGPDADRIDFLLAELDRARIVEDGLMPPDVIRLGSIVRYKLLPGEEQTIKLVLPESSSATESYRLSVTSLHGAALLGLRPGDVMSWFDADCKAHRLKVLKVANPPADDRPGPSAA